MGSDLGGICRRCKVSVPAGVILASFPSVLAFCVAESAMVITSMSGIVAFHIYNMSRAIVTPFLFIHSLDGWINFLSGSESELLGRGLQILLLSGS